MDSTNDSGVKGGTEMLLRQSSSWNDVPYTAYPEGRPQLTTVRITIPPHSTLPWHVHDMPNTAFLLSGQLTVEEWESGRQDVFRAGEAFAESVGNIHRGFTGDDAAVVIVTYAGVPGQPLSRPAEEYVAAPGTKAFR